MFLHAQGARREVVARSLVLTGGTFQLNLYKCSSFKLVSTPPIIQGSQLLQVLMSENFREHPNVSETQSPPHYEYRRHTEGCAAAEGIVSRELNLHIKANDLTIAFGASYRILSTMYVTEG